MFEWTASRCCVGCLYKLGIITVISVVLFCVVLSFYDVYLCILACIFMHKLLYSYTHDVDKFDFKNGIKVVMLYSFVGYFGLQVGNVCWFWFDFVCLVENFVFI